MEKRERKDTEVVYLLEIQKAHPTGELTQMQEVA